MKQFTKLMAMLLFTAATQYKLHQRCRCSNPRQDSLGFERQRSPVS